MNKAHAMINWEDRPSINTPIAARLLNKLDSAVDVIDDRVVEMDANKATKVEVASLVADVSYNEATGIFTITKKNGSVLTIDTKLEKLAINFKYNATTQQLIITLDDGSKQYIDLSALITQYEFMDTDTVTFVIGSDGKVSAALKQGSVSEEYLEPNYLAKIKVEVAKAQSSADAATLSEANAESSAKAAALSEKNAKASEDTAHTNAESAKAFAEQAESAKNDAESARDMAQTASGEAQNNATASAKSASDAEKSASSALDSKQSAESSKQSALQYATDANTSALKAQGYAIGNTDSAKYYYEQSKAISEGFSGALRPRGTINFADLPSTADASSGDMYNIADQFTTTTDFKEGAGNIIPAGSNVYLTIDRYWDVLAGTPVTGVKGSSESMYRRGNVNITPANIGLSNLTNDRQIKGLASGTTNGHIVSFGTDGYTVADSGLIASQIKTLAKPYATCATGRATNAKVATLAGFVLNIGVTIAVKFTDTAGTANPTSGGFTLNVNGTGAKEIGYFRYGVKWSISNTHGAKFCNNAVHIFTYDGTYWLCMDWNADNNTTYSNMTGATASATGKAGLVPAPSAGKQGQFLRGDGTWATPVAVQNNLTSTSTTDALSAAQGKVLNDAITKNASDISTLNSNLTKDGIIKHKNNYQVSLSGEASYYTSTGNFIAYIDVNLPSNSYAKFFINNQEIALLQNGFTGENTGINIIPLTVILNKGDVLKWELNLATIRYINLQNLCLDI